MTTDELITKILQEVEKYTGVEKNPVIAIYGGTDE